MNYKLLLFLILFSHFSCKQEVVTPIKERVEDIKKSISLPKFITLDENYKKKKRKEIDKFYTDKINLDDFSGSFLVAKNGQILLEKYSGYSNYNKKERLTSSTPIHLASISKVMTGTLILRLIDKKKIALETSLQTFFPEFPYSKVTIQTLLTHRSGLPNYLYFTDNDTIWDKSKILTNKDILRLISSNKVELDFIPNSKFSYNNTNYALLALVIEKVTQLPFPKAMKKLLFDPLDMKSTFVFEIEKQKDTVSKNYKSTWEEIPFNFQDGVYGDKNIYSTARDLLKLDLATYSDEFLSKKIKEKAYKGYSYEKKGVNNYGLGIRLREWDDGTIMFYHNGWWHGNKTSYVTLKKDTVALIALSNKYTSKVYQIKRLSSLFGNYPFTIEDEE
ncbi:beta-lactamase family protein [Flavobacterium jejuense]|uniref:Beta-lactamase family protein n=1 Tax=Flavobacterium jejuense TaxID=1544455 RepID=A0ABX0IKT9_9FLAO|nr:serine hydrolase domain-containing protein [Flavobacterium jejuense]NHN24198.1 beta-lactamase family protein [Flavobacterium jejuense]